MQSMNAVHYLKRRLAAVLWVLSPVLLGFQACAGSGSGNETIPSFPARTPDPCGRVDRTAFVTHMKDARFRPLAELTREMLRRFFSSGYAMLRYRNRVTGMTGHLSPVSRSDLDRFAAGTLRDTVLACQDLSIKLDSGHTIRLGSGAHLAVTLSARAARTAMYSSWIPYHTAAVSEEVVLSQNGALQMLRQVVGTSRPGTIERWSVAHQAVVHEKAAVLALWNREIASLAPSDGVWSGFSVAHMAALLHPVAAIGALEDARIRELSSSGFGGLTVAHVAVRFRPAAAYALLYPQIYSLRAGEFGGWNGLTVAHFIAVFHAREMIRFLKEHPEPGTLKAMGITKPGRVLTVSETAEYFAFHSGSGESARPWILDVM